MKWFVARVYLLVKNYTKNDKLKFVMKVICHFRHLFDKQIFVKHFQCRMHFDSF